TTPLVGAALPILLGLKDRKHISEAPTLCSVVGPAVIVPLHTAGPHHRIDAAAAAEYVTERHVEFAIVQLRRRSDGQAVIEGPTDVVEPDAWIHDSGSIVWSS